MNINNDNYSIKIFQDDSFTLETTDNPPFDYFLNPNHYKKNDHYKSWKIKVSDICGNQIIIVLIANFYSYGSSILIHDKLIFLNNTSILSIDLLTHEVFMYPPFSEGGVFFSIEMFDGGYIIYGELEIVKLSTDFEVEWNFGARDIFVTNDGRHPFTIIDNHIILNCWDGYNVTINRFGEEI